MFGLWAAESKPARVGPTHLGRSDRRAAERRTSADRTVENRLEVARMRKVGRVPGATEFGTPNPCVTAVAQGHGFRKRNRVAPEPRPPARCQLASCGPSDAGSATETTSLGFGRQQCYSLL